MCGDRKSFVVDSFLIGNAALLKESSYWRHSLGWTILFTVIGLGVFISGVVGNGMVILVLYRMPRMRTVTNIFVLNLAVADILVALFCVPGTLLSAIITPWLGGSFLCKAHVYIQGVAILASAYSIFAISLDRCIGLYSALHRRQGLTKNQATVLIGLIWTSALLLMVPRLIFVGVEEIGGDIFLCLDDRSDSMARVHVLFTICTSYGLPSLLVFFTNLFIWCKVSRRKVPSYSASVQTVAKIHLKTKNAVRRKLFLVTFLFLISWLPLYALMARIHLFPSWAISDNETSVFNVLLPLAQLLGCWNSSVNPVVYAFINPEFRTISKLIFLCKTHADLAFERRSSYLKQRHELHGSSLRTQTSCTSITTTTTTVDTTQSSTSESATYMETRF